MTRRAEASLVEVLIALVVLVMLMVPTIAALCASHHQTTRAEDLKQFQGVAGTLLDAAARLDFEELDRRDDQAWRRWQESLLGEPRPGLTLRSGVESTCDPDMRVFTVEVRWESPLDRGRRTAYQTCISRVLVRPESSLSAVVPLS